MERWAWYPDICKRCRFAQSLFYQESTNIILVTKSIQTVSTIPFLHFPEGYQHNNCGEGFYLHGDGILVQTYKSINLHT